VLAVALAGAGWAAYWWWTLPRPTPPTEIYRGVTYSCERIENADCRGLVHIVCVALSAPGIGLDVTPVDPDAVRHGYQYRLADLAGVLRRENLAVVVNGDLFAAEPGLYYRSGDLANGLRTIIADGEASHFDRDSYMLWFEPDLTPHIETVNPPSESVMRRARWGIGSAAVQLRNGHVQPVVTNHIMDRRTAIGIDARRQLLWLVAFENASSFGAAEVLRQHGVQDGFLLDGGHSTTMVLGPNVGHVQSGSLIGGSRPVATWFGIKAASL
jgi:hypothetical protein